MLTFQNMILALQRYWGQQGCLIVQPYDLEMGAGTFHPATFLKAIGPEPWKAAYVQPSRRPTDGRYGHNPNRLQHYYQFQVAMKPAPSNLQSLYIQSLEALLLTTRDQDIRFVEDNWASPTLGAWGLGWEIWLNGLEVSQVTYFQEVGGQACRPVLAEITYGLERLAMLLQNTASVYDIVWADDPVTYYGQIFLQSEQEYSAYNFEHSQPTFLKTAFDQYEQEVGYLTETHHLPLPAYDMTIRCSHIFNLLEARGCLSVAERTRYIGRIRQLAKKVAQEYYCTRKNAGFPLIDLAQSSWTDFLGEKVCQDIREKRKQALVATQ